MSTSFSMTLTTAPRLSFVVSACCCACCSAAAPGASAAGCFGRSFFCFRRCSCTRTYAAPHSATVNASPAVRTPSLARFTMLRAMTAPSGDGDARNTTRHALGCLVHPVSQSARSVWQKPTGTVRETSQATPSPLAADSQDSRFTMYLRMVRRAVKLCTKPLTIIVDVLLPCAAWRTNSCSAAAGVLPPASPRRLRRGRARAGGGRWG